LPSHVLLLLERGFERLVAEPEVQWSAVERASDAAENGAGSGGRALVVQEVLKGHHIQRLVAADILSRGVPEDDEEEEQKDDQEEDGESEGEGHSE